MKIWRIRKESAYGEEVGYLKRVMEGDKDPHDYSALIPDFIESNPEMMNGTETDYDDEGWWLWLEEATEDKVAAFMEWVEDNGHRLYEMGEPMPANQDMDFSQFVKPTWLVHFTDDAWSVSAEGFKFGHEDVSGLGLTTHKRDRKIRPGYNFAFMEGSSEARWAASTGKYGKEAVVMFAGGVQVTHWGDEEEQVIIWGPSVRQDMIFPVYNDGDWCVKDAAEREVHRGGFEEMTTWVETNYRQLQSTETKMENRMREERRRAGTWFDALTRESRFDRGITEDSDNGFEKDTGDGKNEKN